MQYIRIGSVQSKEDLVKEMTENESDGKRAGQRDFVWKYGKLPSLGGA
jgi:hypothetical protein